MMAFSKVDNQRRLNLHMDLCDFAHFSYGDGKAYMIIAMNDEGTEFDIVPESEDLCIDGTVKLDNKCRIFIPTWMKNITPGTPFKVRAVRNRIHVKVISKMEFEQN